MRAVTEDGRSVPVVRIGGSGRTSEGGVLDDEVHVYGRAAPSLSNRLEFVPEGSRFSRGSREPDAEESRPDRLVGSYQQLYGPSFCERSGDAAGGGSAATYPHPCADGVRGTGEPARSAPLL